MRDIEFDRKSVPEHLKERVRNWRNLSVGDRLVLTHDLSEEAWARIGIIHDPNKRMDTTIRRIRRARFD